MKRDPRIERHTFGALKTAKSDKDMSIAAVEIGKKGKLNAQHASDAAKALLSIRDKYPAAEILLSIDGYDDDPRALWEVSEVRNFIAILLDMIFAEWPGGSLADLNLHKTSLAVVELCIRE